MGLDGHQDKSRIQVCVETSQAERHAGMNVSYENSFNAIKKDIAKETVDKMKAKAAALGAANKEQAMIPVEEKPNKPKEKLIVKNMGGNTPNQNYQYSNKDHILNLTQDFKSSSLVAPANHNQSIHISTTPDELLNRTSG